MRMLLPLSQTVETQKGILCAADTTLGSLDLPGPASSSPESSPASSSHINNTESPNAANGTAQTNILLSTDGIRQAHVCRDWERVYEFVRRNQRSGVWET